MKVIPLKSYLFPFTAVLILLYSSCKDDITGNKDPVIPEPIPNPYSTVHFTFYYTSYDSLYIKKIADTLEHHYSRILGDLLTDTVLKTSIHFYMSHEELAYAVRNVVSNLPPWAIGLATAKDKIHMLSPKHPDQD